MSKLTADEVAEANRRMIANATKKKRQPKITIEQEPLEETEPVEDVSEKPKRRGRPPKEVNADE